MEERIKEIIEEMGNEDVRNLWNEYCSNDNRMDDWIYDMSEFDEQCSGMTPTEVGQSIWYGDFRINDSYFCYNGYENFDSFDFIVNEENSPFYIDELVNYIIENEDSLMNDDIAEILAEEGEEEEE